MKYIKTIYSWMMPETRTLTEELWVRKPHNLYDNNYLGSQVGKEKEFFDQWVNWSKEILSGVDQFQYRYVGNGSSEGIRELIYQEHNQKRILHFFKGEYEGFKAYAEACGMTYKEHNRNDFKNIKLSNNDTFILSHPSSIDGNIWEDFDLFAQQLNLTNTKLLVDLCYVGTVAKDYHINLGHPNIESVIMSLSKVYGVYFHRIGGIVSKKEQKGLIGNQWFKNMFSLELGIQLMKNFSVKYLPTKYIQLQKKACLKFKENHGIELQPSDVFILGYSEKKIDEFARLEHSRVCLTPKMDQLCKK